MNGKTWLIDEIAYLLEHYPNERSDKIAEALNKSIKSVYSTAFKMGLKKSKEFLHSSECGRLVKGHQKGKITQFKKGVISHNKGKKMNTEQYEKALPTMFKKGQISYNHKPVGYERITRDGYVEVKTNEPNVFKLKHRLVYEEKNGAIPKGYVIAFKDHNKLNVNIDNLKLITLQENMQRNTIHRYPEELKSAIFIHNKLVRTIKKHKKNE